MLDILRTPVLGITLESMLERPRFARTANEEALVQRLLQAVPKARVDDYGNVYALVGTSRTIFSSHTDTVHKHSARCSYKLQVEGHLVQVAGGGVLGADCAAGIYIMLRMIRASVPGLYVFHRDEEIGGMGSQYFARNLPKLGEYDRCIAFDRAGAGEVITHQSGVATASTGFAEALCAELGMRYRPSAKGVFTDSLNYMDVVPECTNISVGYYGQHTKHEVQDLVHLDRLAQQCLLVPWEKLPVHRSPAPTYWGYSDYFDVPSGPLDANDIFQTDCLRQLVQENPEEVADFLYYQLGADCAELEEYLNANYRD